MNLESFKEAFRDGIGGNRVKCHCGKVYYNPDGFWDWDEGELEALNLDDDAKALDYTTEYLSVEGVTYAIDCDCWHSRAEQIMRFLDGHRAKVGAYFAEERRRLMNESKSFPEIKPLTRA